MLCLLAETFNFGDFFILQAQGAACLGSFDMLE